MREKLHGEERTCYYNLALPKDILGRLEVEGKKELKPVMNVIKDFISLRMLFDSCRQSCDSKNVAVGGEDVQLDLIYSQAVSNDVAYKNLTFSEKEYEKIKEHRPINKFIIESCLLGLRLTESRKPFEEIRVGIGEKSFMFI